MITIRNNSNKTFHSNKELQINFQHNKPINLFLNIIIICAGITINTPLPYFKYPFLLSALIIIFISINFLITNRKFISFIKKNPFFSLFSFYLLFLVTIKHILDIFIFDGNTPMISGYGEVINILFGFFFFSLFELKKIQLFIVSYIITFSFNFIFFGQNTLYDYGNVCRTIGAYGNPNTLALYACISFFFSIYLIKILKNKIKYIFIIPTSMALACIINSSSRSMYLGIFISALVGGLCFICFKIKKRNGALVKKSYPIILMLFLISVLSFTKLYTPQVQNSVVNFAVSKKAQQNVTKTKTGISRVINDTQLTTASSISTNRRFDIWKKYLDHIEEYIYFGSEVAGDAIYFPESGRVYDSHNMFLYVLYNYGIIALLLFVFLLANLFFYSFKNKYLLDMQTVLFLGMCTILVHGLLHDAVKTGVFWSIIGLLQKYKNFKKQNNIYLIKGSNYEFK